jgi:hypothetical protein
MEHELTEDEKKAIRSLERLAKKWPKSLWLYSGNGSLFIIKNRSDGGCDNGFGKGVDPNCIVKELGKQIPNDGGDWD